MKSVENSSLDKKVDNLLRVKEGTKLDKVLDKREAKILAAKKKRRIMAKY